MKLVNYIHVDREEFMANMTDDKADGFARTFVAKANMGGDKYWDNCLGVYSDDGLMGAIIVTVSIRKPHVANLQLLHTFAKHRRKGAATLLVQAGLNSAINEGAEYMRVSSEIPAFSFYEALGFEWIGEQKSGCRLSMFKINGEKVSDGLFDINDPVINKAAFTKAKGGCVKIFK